MQIEYKRTWHDKDRVWDIIPTLLAKQIKDCFDKDSRIFCDEDRCVIELDIENLQREKLDFLVQTHKAKVLEGPMPTGHHIYHLPAAGTKWEKFQETVYFPWRLKQTPASISLTNVLLLGASDLQIEQINTSGFMFSITSLGFGEQLGATGVEFDWEAKA